MANVRGTGSHVVPEPIFVRSLVCVMLVNGALVHAFEPVDPNGEPDVKLRREITPSVPGSVTTPVPSLVNVTGVMPIKCDGPPVFQSVITRAAIGFDEYVIHALENVLLAEAHSISTFMFATQHGPPVAVTETTPGNASKAVSTSDAVPYSGKLSFVDALRNNHMGLFEPADECFCMESARIVIFIVVPFSTGSSMTIDAPEFE
jgi:hypothetical protein